MVKFIYFWILSRALTKEYVHGNSNTFIQKFDTRLFSQKINLSIKLEPNPSNPNSDAILRILVQSQEILLA